MFGLKDWAERTDYEVLKEYGFSAAKAAEITLDAQRGDAFAKRWIELVRESGET